MNDPRVGQEVFVRGIVKAVERNYAQVQIQDCVCGSPIVTMTIHWAGMEPTGRSFSKLKKAKASKWKVDRDGFFSRKLSSAEREVAETFATGGAWAFRGRAYATTKAEVTKFDRRIARKLNVPSTRK